VPQSIPAGLLVTFTLPLNETLKMFGGGGVGCDHVSSSPSPGPSTFVATIAAQ
jgi:hypothetical protein